MAVNHVFLVFDIYDGEGRQVTYGSVACTLNTSAVDAPDRMIITPAPVRVPFGGTGSPQVQLLANDSPGPVPQGSAWNLKFSVPGMTDYAVQLFAGPAAFTATSATPAVFTWTRTSFLTSLPNGTGVQLTGGSLPAGFTAGTTYFVVSSSGTTFQLSLTQGGSAIASTSTGSGTLTVTQYNLSALVPLAEVTETSPIALLGGDLAGSPAQVTGIQGTDVQASPGGTADFLRADGSWAAPAGGGSGGAVDQTASDIQPLGSRAAGSTGLAADAGHVHPATGLALTANNLSDLANAAAARTNLGLGTAATQALSSLDARYVTQTGSTMTGPLVVSIAPSASPSGLPVGYGTSTALTGPQVASSHPGDDVTGGTDGTGRISLYSYQRADVNSFGETIRNFLMRWDAKAMTAWYGPSSLYDGSGNAVGTTGWKPWTWAGSHYESNGDNGVHGHYEIEVPDSAGAMQGRLEIPFIDSNPASGTYGQIGVDVTNIMINQAYLTQNSQWGALRIASPAASVPRVLEFANSIYTGTAYAAATPSARWQVGADAGAEAGGNAGSDFGIWSYDDSAAALPAPLKIQRKTGLVTLSGGVAAANLPATSAAPTGMIAQTVPLYLVTSSAATVASGQMYLYAIELAAGQTVSNITFLTGSTAAAGVTHAWFALLDSGYVQRAHSADQTSGALAASTLVTKALASPYTAPSTGKYYLAIVVAATTMPTMASVLATISQGGSAAAAFPLAGPSTTSLSAPGTDGTTTYIAPTSAGNYVYGYAS